MRHHEKGLGARCSEALGNDLATSLITSENSTAVTACEAPPLVTITLVGAPQGKGADAAFLRSSHVGHDTPAVTRSDDSMIRTAAVDAMGTGRPPDPPIEIVLRSVFPVPASYSAKPRNQAIVGEIAWGDALNSVVFRDEALITRAVREKTCVKPLRLVMLRAAR